MNLLDLTNNKRLRYDSGTNEIEKYNLFKNTLILERIAIWFNIT